MNKNSMDTAANLFRPLITRDRTNLDLPLLLKELQVMLVLLLVSSYAITTPSSDSEPDFSMAFKKVIDCCANLLNINCTFF